MMPVSDHVSISACISLLPVSPNKAYRNISLWKRGFMLLYFDFMSPLAYVCCWGNSSMTNASYGSILSVHVFLDYPSVLHRGVCRGGERRGGRVEELAGSIVSQHSFQAKAAACRLQHAYPGGAWLRPLLFARTWDEEHYCTSLLIPHSPLFHARQHHCEQWGCGQDKWGCGPGGCNRRPAIDKYSRRPGLCSTKMGETFLRKHLFPLQTPK